MSLHHPPLSGIAPGTFPLANLHPCPAAAARRQGLPPAVLLGPALAGPLPTTNPARTPPPTTSATAASAAAFETSARPQEGGRRGQLGLPTFLRLNASVMLQGMLGLTVLSQAVSIRTPQLTGVPVCIAP
jgi:hypothetical protein